MKTLTSYVALALSLATPAMADKFDDEFRHNRKALVAAVKLLVTLPPNCTVNNQRPDPYQIAKFALDLGVRDYDTFIAEVKAKDFLGEGYNQLSPSEQRGYADSMCAFGILLSQKVLNSNK